MKRWFSTFATTASEASGSPWAFLCAVLIILVWAASGPLLHFSDTWQLAINTFTTLVTFLMVFLIQHSQNRDTKAIQEKLDEVIRATDKADDSKIGIEKEGA